LTLIATVLISALVLAGFLYDTFTVYTGPAEVAAQGTSCSASGTSETCQFSLANQGASSVTTDGVCSMSVGGSKVTGTIQNGGTVPPSGSISGVSCVVSGATASNGAQIVGALALANGAFVYFVGTSN
jgi:hypothetical protein